MSHPQLKSTRTEKKAALLAHAERLIDQLLDWSEATTPPTVTQLEDQALALRQEFGQALAQTALTTQAEAAEIALPPCPHCGQPMRPKGWKEKTVLSRLGELQWERPYFYCPACRQGFFPLDERLQVGSAHWSEGLAQWVVWLYGQQAGAGVRGTLQRLTGLDLAEGSIWREMEGWGQRIQAHAAHEAAQGQAVPLRGQAGPTVLRTERTMGVAMDGTMVHVRQEGWKELKVGCVFEVALRPEKDPETGEEEERAHAVANSYVGYLGGPEAFGVALWGEAVRRGWATAKESVVLGDGAHWIWNLAQEHYGDSRQVVDWYHGKQHLHRAGNLAFGEGSAAAQAWVKQQRTPLFQGQAWAVADAIRVLAEQHPQAARALQSEVGYFTQNQRRMQYMEVRAAGMPIGSGMVESGCKQFGVRFAGAGMRWSRTGAERLIPLRAAILSGRFDQVWQAACNAPLN